LLAGLLMVTLAAASWGTWSLFLRPTGLSAAITTPIMMTVMGVVALPFALRAPRTRWDRQTIALLLGNAACDSLNVLTFFASINYTTVAIAVITHYVAPIMIALAAPYIEKRATGARTWPAAIVALVGLVIVLEPWQAPTEGAAIGAALGVVSAMFYTGNMFVVRRLALRIGAPRAMSYHSLIAAAAFSPALFIAGVDAIEAPDLALVAAGAATIGAGGGVMFAVGLTRIGSARAAVLTFAEPLVAVAVGALVWHEPLHPLAAAGGVLVIGAGIHVARKAR
jgi:drug/metabolite transporter (DMT)-like permease